MSTNAQSRTPKTAGRPGRSLAILAIVLVALLAAVFIQGATSIKLGLDLRGGTSVTLQPRLASGESGKVTASAIDQAVSIIRQRVNSLGVAESEVTSQGSGVNRQIVISVPGDTGRRVVELVGQTAELRFRQRESPSADCRRAHRRRSKTSPTARRPLDAPRATAR